MNRYKVKVILRDVYGDIDDEDDFKEAVKEAIQVVLDNDDEVEFVAEEMDEEDV